MTPPKPDAHDESLLQYTFARQRVESVRRKTPSRMPDWLRIQRDAYRDRMADAARKCYEETGLWFFARGAAREKDEQESYAVWADLLYFGGIQSLPGYSPENHRRAVEFWQSWQNRETGRLYNPLYQDPQKPEVRRHSPGNRSDYAPEKINLKYISAILAKLGARLPCPANLAAPADAEVDTFDELWRWMPQWATAPAGAFPFAAAERLNAGDTAQLPQVEAGMGALVRAYNRRSGMWRPEPLEGFPWHDYQPSSGFKIISRICGYAGMENFPEPLHKTAVDNLLAHRSELYQHPAMARNYGETFAHYLMLADYRREEQLDAMEECLNGFRAPAWWENTGDGCYCVFGSGMIGAFMNWEDLPFDQALGEWQRFVHGCTMKWRFIADPYGNWVNAVPKEPQAVFGHPGYDLSRYGLMARNKDHWSRRPVDVTPQQDVPLALAPGGGTGEGALIFALTPDQLTAMQSPHLKATWTGAFDIALNGRPVKQVRYNLPDAPAGWIVPAASMLRTGENRVTVKLLGPGKDPLPGAPLSTAKPFIRLGLMDCRSPRR